MVEIGQVRQVRPDVKMAPGAKLHIGDKFVVKEVEPLGNVQSNSIVTLLHETGEVLYTTYGWIERWSIPI